MTARVAVDADNAVRAGRPTTSTPRVPGEVGVWVFILGDASVFTYVFVVFLTYRRHNADLFHASREYLSQHLGVVNTLVLLVSSLFVIRAGRAFRAGNTASGPRWFIAALTCGAVFVALKAVEYREEIIGGNSLNENVFFNFYYLMTGLHLMHLIVGIGVLAYLVIVSRRAEQSTWATTAIEGGSCYWHMVDFLWIIIFALLYLIR